MSNADIITEKLMAAQSLVNRELTRTLTYLGEQCVKRVRERPQEVSWNDHTTNLRNSICFAASHNGGIVSESASDTQTEGGTIGIKVAEQLATETAAPFKLVISAGMDYAAYVEAIESKDVLASTELWCKQKAPQYLEMTKQRIDKLLKDV